MQESHFFIHCFTTIPTNLTIWWANSLLCMLWFKFILASMFFKLVSILFAIVPDYGNEYMTKENKNWGSLKNFAPKLNLNHNTYHYCSNWTVEVVSLWMNVPLCGCLSWFRILVVAVSCCNSQSEMLTLVNKPIRLQEIYTQCLLFL